MDLLAVMAIKEDGPVKNINAPRPRRSVKNGSIISKLAEALNAKEGIGNPIISNIIEFTRCHAKYKNSKK